MPAQPGRDVGSPWVTHGRGLGVFGALAVEAFTLFQEKKELRTRPCREAVGPEPEASLTQRSGCDLEEMLP